LKLSEALTGEAEARRIALIGQINMAYSDIVRQRIDRSKIHRDEKKKPDVQMFFFSFLSACSSVSKLDMLLSLRRDTISNSEREEEGI
jgi:hypothetical protein